MKKTYTLVSATAIISIILMCSYVNGPATHGWDCTGAETGSGNVKGCTGSGCHGTTADTGITVALELDSAGTPVTSYKAGLTYTVKITGVNTTTNTLPKFGFQVTAIKGATSQVTPVNAGTFVSSGLPTGVHLAGPTTYDVANIIEHDQALNPASGTGGTGTTYTESFNWTAPAAGTGTVSFWGALNAVNDDGNASSADKWNNQNLVIAEDTTVINSITEAGKTAEINIYPNPVTDLVQVELNNAENGSYNLEVFDIAGRKITSGLVEVTGNNSSLKLHAENWPAGVYLIQISKGGQQQTTKLVKR